MKWAFTFIVLFFIFWVFSWSLEENDEKKKPVSGGQGILGLLFALLLSPLLAMVGLLLLLGKVLLPIIPRLWDVLFSLLEEFLLGLRFVVRAALRWMRSLMRGILPVLRRLFRLCTQFVRIIWNAMRLFLRLCGRVGHGLARMIRKIGVGIRSLLKIGRVSLTKFPRFLKVMLSMERFMRHMIAVSLYRTSDEHQRETQVLQKVREHVSENRSEKSVASVDCIFIQKHRTADTARNVKRKNATHKTQEHSDVMHTLRAIGWSVRQKMQHHA